MRFLIVFTLAAAVVSTSAFHVVRQSIPPACFYTCTAQVAAQAIASCTLTDTVCLCKDSTYVSGALACVERTCQGADIQAAINAGYNSCLAVGVTLTASSTAPAPAPTNIITSTTTPTPTVTVVVVQSGSNLITSTSVPSGSSSSSSPVHNNSTDAIIGGVIGGLVLILLILLVVFLIYRHKNRRPQTLKENLEKLPESLPETAVREDHGPGADPGGPVLFS